MKKLLLSSVLLATLFACAVPQTPVPSATPTPTPTPTEAPGFGSNNENGAAITTVQHS